MVVKGKEWYATKEGTGTGTTSDAIVLEYRGGNRIDLWSHSEGRWIFAAPGAPVILEDTNCSLDMSQSSINGAGEILTINVRITPKPAFIQDPLSGNKRIWLQLRDAAGNTLRNAEVGSWSVHP